MAFLRLKSPRPSKLTFSVSGNTLEVRSSNNEGFPYIMADYINSMPEDFDACHYVAMKRRVILLPQTINIHGRKRGII